MILVVEDDDSTRELVCLVIEDWGLAYDSAVCVRSALAKLAEIIPRILLTDMLLPDGDALPVIGECRARHPHAKIVVMSAMQRVKLDALIEGVEIAHVISKPFELEELHAHLLN